MRCVCVILRSTLRKCLWSVSEVIFLGNSTIDRVLTAARKFHWSLGLRGCYKANKEGTFRTRCVFCPEKTGSEWPNILSRFKKLRNWFNDSRNSIVDKCFSASCHLSFICIFRENSNLLYFWGIPNRKLGPQMRDFYRASQKDYVFYFLPWNIIGMRRSCDMINLWMLCVGMMVGGIIGHHERKAPWCAIHFNRLFIFQDSYWHPIRTDIARSCGTAKFRKFKNNLLSS